MSKTNKVANEADTNPTEATGPYDALAAFAALDAAPSEDATEEAEEDAQDDVDEDTVNEDEDDLEDDLDDEEDEDEDDPEEDAEADDDDEDEDEDDEPKRKKKRKEVEVTDDTLGEVKVNGEVEQVSIKDLRRLAGQEKALTRKSMAVSAAAEKAKAREEFAESRLQKAKEKAEARAEEYKKIDFEQLAASNQYTPEQIEQWRQQAADAKTEADFFNEELDSFYKGRKEAEQKDLIAKGTEALEQFNDPASIYYIEDFQERYNDLAAHATKLGIPQEKLLTTPDPWFWKMVDESLRRGSAQKSLKKSVTKKTTKKVKKPSASKTVLKSRKSNRTEQRGRSRDRKREAAMAQLKKTGSKQAALNAFAALD